MKPKLRDYLTIIFALLVIFICGCGVGFLIGEKEGRQETETPTAIGSEHDSDTWQKQTMESLRHLTIEETYELADAIDLT